MQRVDGKWGSNLKQNLKKTERFYSEFNGCAIAIGVLLKKCKDVKNAPSSTIAVRNGRN